MILQCRHNPNPQATRFVDFHSLIINEQCSSPNSTSPEMFILEIFRQQLETSCQTMCHKYGWPTEKQPISYIQQAPHSELEVNPLPPILLTEPDPI
uniref:Uncharacterized protein n=1 Tax=Timema poppense TaxID=170557 RepID=A0A7R9CZN8_TIMPO|nr:unnamed protein product [Timema poppensis]